MGVKERRERQKEELRQEILDAARDLFIKEGYENVSMRKVAEKIEYSPTTIYLYFQDKADLLYSLCQETFAKLMQTFAELESDRSDALTKLKKGMRLYINFGLQYPNHYKVTFINHPEHHEDSERYLKADSLGMKAYMQLRNCVSDCVKAKQFRKVDIDAITQIIWASQHGLVSLFITHPDFPWVDREKLINELINTLVESHLA